MTKEDKFQISNENLTDVKLLKNILAQKGLRPQKRLGQHFLVDRQVLQRLLEAAEISSSDTIIEVGAGIGTITVELAKQVKKVYAVDIDKNLIPILKFHINDFKNVNVLQGDILKLNFCARNDKFACYPLTLFRAGVTTKVVTSNKVVTSKFVNSGGYKVIGAIPYQITSPLVHHLLIQENQPSLIAIIIQKEVAEKIIAKPPKATYLSNFVGVFGRAEVVGKSIPPSAFWPQPDVYSAILKINFSPKLDSSIARSLEYSEFLHRGFSHPRKMLNKVFDEKLLAAAGIFSTRRAQTLTQEEWLELFKHLRVR